jgi:hypothetical protein
MTSGIDLGHSQISVDIFAFSHARNQFKNLITFQELARASNGSFFYYPDFQAALHGLKF